MGAVAAKDLKLKDKNVAYEFEGIFGPGENIYVDSSGYPELVIVDSSHPISSLYYLAIIIDGNVYMDFDYSDFWHAELNYITQEAILEVDFEFTFNLPGNPTIIGHSDAMISNYGTPDRTLQGTLTLVGTGLFDEVKGYAEDEGWDVEGGWYIHHVGVIKNWPGLP